MNPLQVSPDDQSFFGHPRGLAYLAFTEAWERFSFSGMQTLLVLYMVGHLLLPGEVENVIGFESLRSFLEMLYGKLAAQPLSSAVFGLYTGLVFFMPVFGGLLGDRWFGQHAMVMAGAVFMTVGHFMMAFEASFLIALALLILGSGCLKGNISKQVSGLYEDQDRRRTDGFQIFSMAINTGVIVAPFICGTLGEIYGWHYGFGAAGIGMMIGLAIYVAGHKYLPPDFQRDGPGTAGPVLPEDRRLLLVLLLVFVTTTCFLVAAGQLGNVYNLWLRDHVDRGIGSYVIPVTWFQSLTPLFSVAATPLVIALWRRQSQQRMEPALFTKIGLGLVMAAGGLFLLGFLSDFEGIDWWWVLPAHLLVCFAYIFVYPVGLALFSRAAPAGARATYIGIFFLTSFVASNLVGYTGGFYATLTPTAFWALHGLIGLGGAMLVLATGRPLGRILEAQEQAPAGSIHAQ